MLGATLGKDGGSRYVLAQCVFLPAGPSGKLSTFPYTLNVRRAGTRTTSALRDDA